MTKDDLSKEAREAYDLAIDCEGVEMHLDWDTTTELKASGLCDFGGARGPDRKWVRMWPKELDEEDRV